MSKIALVTGASGGVGRAVVVRLAAHGWQLIVTSRKAAREAAARQYPLPGIGSPDELAELMVWLLSDSALRVTGQIWSLDGGFSSIRPWSNEACPAQI